MSENKRINEIFKSREKILEILDEQGYNVSEYVGFSVSEIHSLSKNEQLDLLLTKKDDVKKGIY